MTWQDWSASMLGTGRFAGESNETKLEITAQMEEAYLKKVYRIPLATSTSCTLLAYKAQFITPDYNLAYGWGGLELMTYNYSVFFYVSPYKSDFHKKWESFAGAACKNRARFCVSVALFFLCSMWFAPPARLCGRVTPRLPF